MYNNGFHCISHWKDTTICQVQLEGVIQTYDDTKEYHKGVGTEAQDQQSYYSEEQSYDHQSCVGDQERTGEKWKQ